jgi:NAD(P)-dependent dehydrogenase (short-subunit alcohol dehydrogenase family)
VDTIAAALGTVSILVNNAAIPDAQYATKMSTELVDRVIATNLRAPFLLSSAVARRLIAQKLPGRIVNVSSMGAHHYRGEAGSLYSTTKAALERMTETLAVEWAKFHINVNAIAPGAFATEMLQDMIQRHGEVSSGFPRDRLGDPAQLDSTLLYLVSPSSEFVTGTIVKVDDGQNPR